MKKYLGIGSTVIVLSVMAYVAYAISTLFFTKTETSNLSKKTIFQFDMSTGMKYEEVGPGDSFDVSPTVYNDATEEMYVFIEVDQPVINNESLYTYNVSDEWKTVSSTAEKQVYAYAGNEMTVVLPDETTSSTTSRMEMKNISNAEYAQIDDINITITGYAIGTDGISTEPTEAWEQCREIGGID